MDWTSLMRTHALSCPRCAHRSTQDPVSELSDEELEKQLEKFMQEQAAKEGGLAQAPSAATSTGPPVQEKVPKKARWPGGVEVKALGRGVWGAMFFVIRFGSLWAGAIVVFNLLPSLKQLCRQLRSSARTLWMC